jgi:hypothetical protein
MANSNGWGDGAANNTIGWGQGANNAIGWGSVYAVSSAGRTDIIGATATAPVNLTLPFAGASSLYVTGQITTTDGTWSGSPTSFTYQWKRGATNIGTNANIYSLVEADAGLNITCVVTAINATGSTPATSNVIVPLALAAPTNIDLPVIDDGTTWMVGMIIGFTGNNWDGNPVPTLTYQWQRYDINISGATDETYELTPSDEGYMVGVKCTATNTQGTAFELSNTVLIEP